MVSRATCAAVKASTKSTTYSTRLSIVWHDPVYLVGQEFLSDVNVLHALDLSMQHPMPTQGQFWASNDPTVPPPP
jgi:hypothetical protein